MLEPRFHLWRSYAECDIGTSNSFRLSVCLSVCPSLRPSITHWNRVKTAKHIVENPSAPYSRIILFFSELIIVVTKLGRVYNFTLAHR